MKWIGTFLLTLCLVAAATAETEVRGSITGAIMLPQMELPHSNAWVISENSLHRKLGHEGTLEEIKPPMGFAVGYGILVGGYSRLDATVASMKSEYEVTYTGDYFGESFERSLKLNTHTVPLRIDYTLFTPGFWGDRIKPELGCGLIFLVTKYDTDQTIQIGAETYRGKAWVRGITVGPELRGGVEIMFTRNLAAEVYGTYFTAPMDLDRWYDYDDAEIGPTFEDFTGWAIWLGPRFYWP
jgi:hypothetical protein